MRSQAEAQDVVLFQVRGNAEAVCKIATAFPPLPRSACLLKNHPFIVQRPAHCTMPLGY